MPEILTSKKYAENSGRYCPLCGSENLTGYDKNSDSSIIWQDMECDNCGAAWSDVYKLSGYTDLLEQKRSQILEVGR